jgi:4-amino-4-deoxy-L-arabinose transferase-like glycosyltransferase
VPTDLPTTFEAPQPSPYPPTLAAYVLSRVVFFWRGPKDTPAWGRPAALAIAALAGLSYGWGASRPVNIEIYYAAAARSMSMSPRNFFFGAVDPAGTMSTDKLPGAFWLQAISSGLFGAERWALVLPQVVEGALTVLVLYHAVRRLAGPAAGLLAAGILAISPATVALNRGNISDTLMILLAVLAADAIVTAVVTGRRWPVLLAGLWVGLAFQAKMIEAWLVLPAIAAGYLLAAPGSLPRRIRRTGALAAVAGVVSLSWMTVVALWPPPDRPYVDGSTTDSVFQQVFVYNGFGRLDQASPNQLVTKTLGLGLPVSPPPSWHRLLSGSLGRDTGWLLAAAAIVLIAGLAARRGGHGDGRRDLVRAGLVLWGIWLSVLMVAFSASSNINSYYVAALSPAVAAVLATGIVLAWQQREYGWARLAAAAAGAAVLATAAYAAWLLPAAGTGLPPWLKAAQLALAAVAVCSLASWAWRPRQPTVAAVAIALASAASLCVPAIASVSVVSSGLGPFQTPFESARATAATAKLFGSAFSVGPALSAMEAGSLGAPYVAATQTALLAAPFIFASGQEILPVGGYTGTIPAPSLADLQRLIRGGYVHLFLQSPTTADPRLAWVARHCTRITPKAGGSAASLPLAVYYCFRGNAPAAGAGG